MNNLFVVISGAAHSGKTICIEQLKKDLGQDNVVNYSEIIRSKNINIDEIRKDPIKYLDFEIEVIGKKIEQEKKANDENDNKIIIFDRSLVDSYFYYTFYLDKSSFDEKNLIKYHTFLSTLTFETGHHILALYDIIFLFSPIREQKRFDEYTQKFLNITQENEYKFIRNMTVGFAGDDNLKIIHIDIIKEYDFLLNNIKDLIKVKGIKSGY